MKLFFQKSALIHFAVFVMTASILTFIYEAEKNSLIELNSETFELSYEHSRLFEIVNALNTYRIHHPNVEASNTHLFDYLVFNSIKYDNEVLISNYYSEDGYEVELRARSDTYVIFSKNIPKEKCEIIIRDFDSNPSIYPYSYSKRSNATCINRDKNTIAWTGSLRSVSRNPKDSRIALNYE